MEFEKQSYKNKSEKKKNLIYIIIGLIIIAGITSSYIIIKGKQNNANNTVEEKNKNKSNTETITSKKASSFNSTYIDIEGQQKGSDIKKKINILITNNKRNSNNLIELIFDNVNYGNNINEIRKAKQLLDNETNYTVSFEYDNRGYIYKFIIKTEK